VEVIDRIKVLAPQKLEWALPHPGLTTVFDPVDGSHHRHLGAKVRCRMTGRECPLLAKSRHFEGSAKASAFTPKADINAGDSE
jgi:hypothetical protein